MEGIDLVVTHPAHVAAHNVADQLGVPRIVGTVFPNMIPSAYTVPGGTPFGPWSGHAGRALNRAAWASASASTAAMFDRSINRHRRSLGLTPVRAGLLRLPMAAQATVVMASPAVIDVPPDWSSRIMVTSFVPWDRAEQHAVPASTDAFIDDGEPPVLVTLGASSAVASDDFFDQVTTEVLAAGARALVVTGPAVGPSSAFDPGLVHVAPYLPFSSIARRCRAAVHHSGVGTTVAVMRAGIPQLAIPKGFDQPITAAQIEKLGIGVAIPWRQRHRRLPAAVRQLLGDRELRARAAALAHRFADEDGARATAAAIEGELR